MSTTDKLLISEPPLQVLPTLACYIGLNEALFLQQLHYILTQNSKVGKLADGRKWYRDKPCAFIEKYFPFWDESILKRAMDNLRSDNLLLTRSDLNTRPKDRSLWYGIDYEELGALDSPVNRLAKKSQKRREARQLRGSKVQNVLTTTEVQNVLLTEVQNVLLIEEKSKVQSVPTPIESFPKDSITKEEDINSSLSCSEIWQQVETILANQMTKATWITIFPGTALARENGHYVVTTPSPAALDWLEHRLAGPVENAVSAVAGDPAKVYFKLQEN